MSTFLYVFSGRVIPERALISVSEIPFSVLESADVPRGTLYVEIVLSQIAARFVGDAGVSNIFTLRNIVEDAVRGLLDVAGYCNGYAYDVELVQMIRPATSDKHVFGIDVPALQGSVEGAGITYRDVLNLLGRADGHFLRHSLADAREAIKSPRDTGFFCYRAIESLKNAYAVRLSLEDGTRAWEAFRECYGIAKADIMQIKEAADDVRHGNMQNAGSLTDEARATLFKKTWEMINAYVLKERGAT